MYFSLLILSLASLAGAFNVKLKVEDPAVLFYADSGVLNSTSSFFKSHLSFLEASGQPVNDETPVTYKKRD
jgi:hypothetical protein